MNWQRTGWSPIPLPWESRLKERARRETVDMLDHAGLLSFAPRSEDQTDKPASSDLDDRGDDELRWVPPTPRRSRVPDPDHPNDDTDARTSANKNWRRELLELTEATAERLRAIEEREARDQGDE